MVLSDRSIREELAQGRIVIDPLDPGDIQPASVDLHLDRYLLQFRDSEFSYIDVHENLDALTEKIEIPNPRPFILQTGQFILASTVEYIELPDDIVARLEGKSSLGRLGLLIHSTAGYVDPGWKGTLTLEISNVARFPITLYDRMEIGQISFLRLTTAVERPYGTEELGSKYQGQMGPTSTRLHENLALHMDANSPVRRVTRRRADHGRYNYGLKHWLSSSQFRGNIREFAQALGVKQKTVEDWIYGRYRPSLIHKRLIFNMTQLSEYATTDLGEQGELLPIEHI